jgi:hypothetical protein
MKHSLKHPVQYNGSTITHLNLPDAAQVKHELVSIRIGKMLAEFKKENFVTEDFAEDGVLGLPGEALVRFRELELQCERMLLEAYCEGFPADAIDELSISDKDALVAIIRKLQNPNVTPEKAGAEPGKKSSPRRHSA